MNEKRHQIGAYQLYQQTNWKLELTIFKIGRATTVKYLNITLDTKLRWKLYIKKEREGDTIEKSVRVDW